MILHLFEIQSNLNEVIEQIGALVKLVYQILILSSYLKTIKPRIIIILQCLNKALLYDTPTYIIFTSILLFCYPHLNVDIWTIPWQLKLIFSPENFESTTCRITKLYADWMNGSKVMLVINILMPNRSSGQIFRHTPLAQSKILSIQADQCL